MEYLFTAVDYIYDAITSIKIACYYIMGELAISTNVHYASTRSLEITAHVRNFYSSGCVTSTGQLARWLRRMGHDVNIVTIVHSDPPRASVIDLVNDVELQTNIALSFAEIGLDALPGRPVFDAQDYESAN